MSKTQEWLERRAACTMNNYGTPAIVLDHGEGTWVWDVDGKKYLDLISGIAVNTLGHNHPRLVQALADQAARLIHVSNLYGITPQIELAEALTTNSCMDKAFFCNSGSEAVEGALKLARLYARQKGYENRSGYVSMKNSFHGRTMGALTATGQKKYQQGFEPMLSGFTYADYNDLASVEAAVTDETSAIVLEPIQGEGGVIPGDPDFLAGCRRLCDERDMTLIFDEVQCGMGRTGAGFGYEASGVEPDVMALAKGLGGGVSIGATLARGAHGKVFGPGHHASTFGGNPLACSAALVICDELFNKGLLEHVRAVGAYLKRGLDGLVGKYDSVVEARGRGLMWGLVINRDCPELVGLLAARGVLGNVAAGRVVRIAPPLIITEAECDVVLEALDGALSELG